MALVEGAVSSQDDLKLVQTIRAAQQASWWPSATAPSPSNVPVDAQRHPDAASCSSASTSRAPTQKPGVPTDGVPALLKHAVPLHEVVKVDLHVPGCPPQAERHPLRAQRAARGPQARPRLQAEVRVDAMASRERQRSVGRPAARRAATRRDHHEEDHDRPRHPHRGARQDHDPPRRRGPGRRHAVPRHPGPRLREVHRGPAVLRDAVHHRAHLRHLPGEPPARLGRRPATPSWPSASREAAAHAARAAALRPVRAVARARASSTSRRPTCCSAWTPTRRSATSSACSRSTPTLLRDGIALRKFGQQVIERLAKERVHPSWTVPGGVNAPLDPHARETHPRRAARGAGDRRGARSSCSRGSLDQLPERDRAPSATSRPCTPASWAADGNLQLYDGNLRFVDADGPRSWPTRSAPEDYAALHRRGGDGRLLPEGAVLQAASAIPRASTASGRSRGSTSPTAAARRRPTRSSTSTASASAASSRARFHYHYARLIEATYALERMKQLLDDPAILSTQRARHAPA